MEASSAVVPQCDRAIEVKRFDESKMGVKGLLDAGITTIPQFFIHPAETLSTITKSTAPSNSSSIHIPVIDLSGLNSDDKRPEIVDQVRQACRSCGFFYVTNHGIPDSVMDDNIAAFKAFNEQPTEIKAQHYVRKLGVESGDVVFNTNFDLFHSKAAYWRDTLKVRMGPKTPTVEIPAICRKELLEWTEKVKGLAQILLEVLGEGLGVGGETLKELGFMADRLVANYYPFCPQPDLTMGLQAHTDFSVLTVLQQNEICGLQVKCGEAWIDALPIPGSLIVNVGDVLQIISNGEYKAGEHRVLANSCHDARISIAIFFTPHDRSRLYGPLPELLSLEKPAIYRNFYTEEYFRSQYGTLLGETTVKKAPLDAFKIE